MSAPVEFAVGLCPCPGAPHPDGDTIYLEGELTMQMAVTAFAAMRGAGANRAAQTGALVASYFPLCIRAWTFTDEQGNLREISREAVDELVAWERGGFALADKADSLYSGHLMSPLLAGRPKSSPAGQTPPSTSPSQPSGSRPPRPLRPSSPSDPAGSPSAVPAP